MSLYLKYEDQVIQCLDHFKLLTLNDLVTHGFFLLKP